MAELRLLQTMAGAKHGGAETFFVRLAGALQKRGIAQRVVIRRHGERARELAALGVDTVQAAFGGVTDLTTKRTLRREIAAFRPDVVLSWMSRASAITPTGSHCLVARLGGYYDLKYYRRCDHLICNTEHIVQYVRKGGWPAERVHYLPNFSTFGPAEPVARGALDTPADVPVVLAAGRLHPAKAFDVLLRAMAEVPAAWLWLAGVGPREAALRQLAADLGVSRRVRMLGWRDDVNALMAACDVVACPSRVEPLGNVVLEAWAAGKPIVAARASGPAALIDDGENGLLADVEDAQGLAASISRIIGDQELAARLGAAGARTFGEHFTEDPVVDRYLAFFERVKAQCAA